MFHKGYNEGMKQALQTHPYWTLEMDLGGPTREECFDIEIDAIGQEEALRIAQEHYAECRTKLYYPIIGAKLRPYDFDDFEDDDLIILQEYTPRR